MISSVTTGFCTNDNGSKFGGNGNGSNTGANGNGSNIGSSGNLQVMGSMAFGLGTSAVGSPGFGQFLGPGPNPSSLVSSAAMNPQLVGAQTLFSRQEAVPSGGNQNTGSYHPFGSSGGLNVGLQNTGLNQGMRRVTNALILYKISGHSILFIVACLAPCLLKLQRLCNPSYKCCLC